MNESSGLLDSKLVGVCFWFIFVFAVVMFTIGAYGIAQKGTVVEGTVQSVRYSDDNGREVFYAGVDLPEFGVTPVVITYPEFTTISEGSTLSVTVRRLFPYVSSYTYELSRGGVTL